MKASGNKGNKPNYNPNKISNLNPRGEYKKNPYDLEININSILGFLEKWDIVFGEDGKEKYEKAKKK